MSSANVPALLPPDARIDLTNCDREPIHIPGAVQPYGVLFGLFEPALEVLQVSQSVEQLLGLRTDQVLGRCIDVAVGAAGMAAVRTAAQQHLPAFCQVVATVNGEARQFDAMVHRTGGMLVVELEPHTVDETVSLDAMSAVMRSTIHRLEHAESLVELAQGIADEMRRLTGFDRVWVYRFHPDWHGEIIGESKRREIETWLGMHYPASDIPAQARALFLQNWLRVIPDLGFVPSPLVPQRNPLTGAPLDLGGSLLRSVSPIHVQYLKNMGVTASLVISLIHRGKLWGLISGHHYSGPKRLSYPHRSMCEFLAQALSLQIGSTDRLDERAYALDVRSRQSRLIERIGLYDTLHGALAAKDVKLADALHATGAVLFRNDDLSIIGQTPSRAQILDLVEWLRARPSDVFETSALSSVYEPATEYTTVASGLLAIPLSRDRRDFLLWFRREQRQTVRWAGDPRKESTIDPDGSVRLHPRGSFDLWEEEARGTAQAWKQIEIDAALDIRRAILDVQIRRSEEISQLNEELLVTNSELEQSAAELEIQAQELLEQREQRDELLDRERAAREDAELANRAKADFLAIVSHELRTPLNAIGGYAQLLALGVRGPLTDEQTFDIERIQINQRHLLGLINSILNFTKLEAGQIQFKTVSVPVAALLNGLDALVGPQMRAKSIEFRVHECDERIVVHADEEKTRQILLNLLTNALKFTDAGGSVTVSCRREGNTVSLVVTDTGRGVEASRLASVFEPFVQIDRQITPTHEQGLGLGLAISRELARAMKGELTATSVVGKGSVFTLTLPAA